jgi:hypothetical protein
VFAASLSGCDSSPSAAPGAGGGSPHPYLVSATPALDASDVYPAPVWDGRGESVHVVLGFSEPMHQREDLRLSGTSEPRAPEVLWADDGLSLDLSVSASLSGARPLADFSEYTLDLSPLANDAGRQLDPDRGLDQGTLRFTTGAYDPLLNHSCGHTFFGPFADVAAGSTADLSAPDLGTTHTAYTLLLRPSEDDVFSGWFRTQFPLPGPYRLYFDADVAVTNAAGVALPLTPTRAACPGITHELTIHPDADELQFYFLGPHRTSTLSIIVELIPAELVPQ